MVAPKSVAGTRRVPIATVLRAFLAPAQLSAPADPERLVFGTGAMPFSASSSPNERAALGSRRSRSRSACTTVATRSRA
jgi:hypothetical protein